jgi:hypothetical protein
MLTTAGAVAVQCCSTLLLGLQLDLLLAFL